MISPKWIFRGLTQAVQGIPLMWVLPCLNFRNFGVGKEQSLGLSLTLLLSSYYTLTLSWARRMLLMEEGDSCLGTNGRQAWEYNGSLRSQRGSLEAWEGGGVRMGIKASRGHWGGGLKPRLLFCPAQW